jgi:hypothetical protein
MMAKRAIPTIEKDCKICGERFLIDLENEHGTYGWIEPEECGISVRVAGEDEVAYENTCEACDKDILKAVRDTVKGIKAEKGVVE